MDVENLAVGKISSMIARCSHLQALIATGDKTPFTDGYIYLYGGLARSKTEFLGRVSVQIKGRTRSGKRKDQQSFPVSRTDLLGFQSVSGVLFFYVLVDRRGKQRAPYYAILSPFKIEAILRSVPEEQATISVAFKKLRDKPSEIERIVGLALKTRDQNPALGFDPSLLDKMQRFTIHTLHGLDFEEPVILAPGKLDYALEVITTGGMRVPVGSELHILPASYVEHPIDVVISAGGVSYSDVLRRRIDSTSMLLTLTPGFTLTLTEATEQRLWNFTFGAEGTFEDRLKVARFIGGFLEDGAVEINGQTTPLGVVTDASQTDLTELRRQINLIRLMEELFAKLGVDGSLVDLDAVSEPQIRTIRMLHRALVLGEEIANAAAEVSRGLFSIGKWAVMLIIAEGSAPDKWRFIDPFDPHAPHMFRGSVNDDPSGAFPVTVYDIIDKAELPTLLNLRLDAVVRAYDAIAEADSTLRLANLQVLALLTAADTNPLRSDEFLRAAEALNEWVIAHAGELPIHQINRWQIRWRTDTLTSVDLDAIRELRRSVLKTGGSRATEIELACVLLLGDSAEVDYLVAQLPDEKLAEVRSWPIWNLRGSCTSEATASSEA